VVAAGIGQAAILLAQGAGPEPYARIDASPYRYHGPRQEAVDPSSLDAVRVGVFTPLVGPDGGSGLSLLRGVQLAVADANAEGGLEGTPFELVVRRADQTWGSAREVVGLAYEERVWAVIGSVGGQSTHVAEQVVTKARLPLISPASNDGSLTQVNIPWMFRLMPDDRALMRRLLTRIASETGAGDVVVITSGGSDNRLRAAELERAAVGLGVRLALSLVIPVGERDVVWVVDRVEAVRASSVVLLTGPEDGALVARRLVERHLSLRLFGGPDLATGAFVVAAGAAAEGVVVVAPCDLWCGTPELSAFASRFEERFGARPDHVAAFAYDGARLLVRAVRRAGLDRVAIRDELAATAGFAGVVGELELDATGASTVAPVLAIIRGGRFDPLRTSAGCGSG